MFRNKNLSLNQNLELSWFILDFQIWRKNPEIDVYKVTIVWLIFKICSIDICFVEN